MINMVRGAGLAAIAAVVLGMGLTGCSPEASTSTESGTTASAPPCEGVATSEYGLGNAIRASIADLAALPTRFSTGTGTVTTTPGSADLRVELHLCGPGADLDATKDAASVVAHEIANTESLGAHVKSVTIVNPAASQRISAEPFARDAFAADVTAASLRAQWQVR